MHKNKNKGPKKQTKLSCWKCGKPGHLKRDCRVFKGKNKAGPSGSNVGQYHDDVW